MLRGTDRLGQCATPQPLPPGAASEGASPASSRTMLRVCAGIQLRNPSGVYNGSHPQTAVGDSGPGGHLVNSLSSHTADFRPKWAHAHSVRVPEIRLKRIRAALALWVPLPPTPQCGVRKGLILGATELFFKCQFQINTKTNQKGLGVNPLSIYT